MARIRTGRVKKVADKDLPARKPFDIPYFAHQQLDPKRFPNGLATTPSSLIPLHIPGGLPVPL